MTIEKDKKLSELTRFGIGGNADFFVSVKNFEQLKDAVSHAQAYSLPFVVIGEGTNLLVSDKGYRGLIIQVGFDYIEWDEKRITAKVGGGVNLMAFIEQALARGWAGMENMYGIPGSMGGAVYGNVGAYGTEIKDVLRKILVWKGNETEVMSAMDCDFTYRSSAFKARKDWIVLEAQIIFQESAVKELVAHAQGIIQQRLVKYPEGIKCPGSYFKNIQLTTLNPEQLSKVEQFKSKFKGGKLASGVLLEAAGAKGMSVGDAKVATYHGNLIYNDGNAKADDVLSLAAKLKQLVSDQFGITLEEEVQLIGFE